MRTLIFLISFFYFTSWANSQTIIKMKRDGGVSVIPCSVNGLKLSFIFDTGASDVSISMTEATFMLKNEYLNESDIIGTQNYLDANGNINQGINIILREVEIGGLKLFNVKASIVKNLQAPLLLGQSALSKLGPIQLDLQTNTLTILKGNNSYDFSENKTSFATPKFEIGQNWMGGKIFYIDGTGIHGLIVLDKHIWATTDRAVGNWNEAIKACYNLEDGWRLPSKDELNLMRLNKKVLKREMRYNSSGNPIGDEDDGVYWSSTQCSNKIGRASCRERVYI